VTSPNDGGNVGTTPVRGYRDALSSPIVRRLWAASLASTIGDHVGLGALLFLAADRTGYAIGAAAVLAVGVLPALVTGVVGGPWLDRFHRGRTLAALQLAGGAAVCLPVLFEGTPVVFLTAALLAAIRIATIAVRSGAMAEGVEDERRGPLVALLSSTDQGAQVIGFLTGGALYVAVGADAALLLDAATFVVGAAVLIGLQLPRPETRSVPPPLNAGVLDIWRHPVLRLLGGLVVCSGIVASLPEVLAPSVAGPGDPLRPVVLAAAPAGQAIAMTIMGRSAAIRRTSVQLAHLGALGVALMIAAVAPSSLTVAAANVLVGAGTAWVVGPQLLFLRLAPRARMAQITGTMIAGLAVADGLGSLALAGVADLAGTGWAYASGGAVILCAAVLGWRLRANNDEVMALDRATGLTPPVPPN
jgi:predicted MFS family arabinose efflux permease